MKKTIHTDLRDHIINNISKAIENGYIHIVYQPVIRTMSGKLCGAEVLTRWLDPDRGLILPEEYIPILEDAHKIHILDRFVIEQVCEDIYERVQNDIPVIPVSFNLSGYDFVDGDPCRLIEDLVTKYRLRKNFISFEITESTFLIDDDASKQGINKLFEGGYKIRLDDFGSEYSSLNILNDLEFEEIKIDMQFLHNPSHKSRHIIKSIVSMAKALGIHTLVKGAETEEQVDFLKSIGCEKIQGNYYGKTQPYDDMMQHCRDFGILIESDGEGGLFDKAGLTDVNESTPLAIVMDDGDKFVPLYINDECKETLDSIIPPGSAFLGDKVDSSYESMFDKFREFAPQIIQSNKNETTTYVENGQFIRLSAGMLAEFGQMHIYRIELYNITYNQDEERSKIFDSMIRNTANIYSGIYLWDVVTDSETVIKSDNSEEQVGKQINKVSVYYANIADKVIYQDDRDRFRDFFDPNFIYEISEKSKRGFAVEEFRFKQNDGNYKWLSVVALVLDKAEGRPILVLVRDTAFNDSEFRNSFAKRLLGARDYERYSADGSKWSMDGELWRYLMKNSSICYFWKDRERRFVGASQSFLDAFEIKDISEIYGKTDEDLGWNVDDTLYKRDELAVINQGKRIVNSIGTCVIKGDPRTIAATKLPIYQNGEIIGLLGYFVDTEASFATRESLRNITYTDQITGSLNYRGLIGAEIRFDENFRNNNEEFIAVIIDIPEYDRIRQRYGEKIGDELLKKVHGYIKDFVDIDAVISRLEMCRFIIISRILAKSNSRERIQNCVKSIHDIHDIDGFPCTLLPQYTFVMRSEVKSMDALMDKLFERLAIVEEESYSTTLYSAERIIFDREKFDQMDERIYIMDPENYDLLYVNNIVKSDLRLSDDYDISHRKCYEVLTGSDEPCANCPLSKCTNDRFYTWNNHNSVNGKDFLVRDTLIPWKGRYAKFSMSVCLTNYKESVEKGQEFIYREMAINDAVTIAMQQSSVDVGINKLLQKIGEDFKASGAYILEDNGSDTCNRTYEWHRHDADKDNAGNTVSTPLKLGNRSLGFLNLDDPETDNIESVELMMQTLSRFVSFMIRDRDLLRELDATGNRDPMTGVMNRRALKDSVHYINDSSVALIFGDLNGLKAMNDTGGHEAGDAMIKSAANLMSSLVGSENVYRMGGDEFLIVTKMASSDEADELLKSLRTKCDEKGISIAFGCVWKEGPVPDIEELAKEADRRMYLNKQFMHKNRS